MIEDCVYEEFKEYGRMAKVEDYYTSEQINEMKEKLLKGNWVIKK